jgi:hypothetical protein
MSKAPALVGLLAPSLVAVRSGELCEPRGSDGHRSATCHHAGGHSDVAVSVADDWDWDDYGDARLSVPHCAQWDSRQRGIRLQSCHRVRQPIEPGLPRDIAAALAPRIHRLSLRVDAYTPRRPVEERVPLERRPLSTNLRI